METKIISLPTNDSKIYRQILAFMGFLLNITNQEADVLAELIKLNNEYEALPLEKRAKFILSTDMRKETREYLEIEEKQYNGIIAKLKTKNFRGEPILDEEGIINHNLIFKPSADGFRIEINFINTQVKTTKTTEEPMTAKASEVVSSETIAPQTETDFPLSTTPPEDYKTTVPLGKEGVLEEEDFGINILPVNE